MRKLRPTKAKRLVAVTKSQLHAGPGCQEEAHSGGPLTYCHPAEPTSPLWAPVLICEMGTSRCVELWGRAVEVTVALS